MQSSDSSIPTDSHRPANRDTVVIAGASGFVGKALIPRLADRFNVVALSRSQRTSSETVEWRSCDLFSLLQTEQAVHGARYAIYLVHSMLPAKFTQATFRDIDWVLADNFARACESAGIEQIIYLGGLIPNDDELSEHLASRLEVALALRARKPAVTVLQAGLIIGAGGSSFQMLHRLVRALPVMVCPKWTQSMSQPIALADTIELLARCVGDEQTYNAVHDIGGPSTMSYIDMMQRTASVMKVKRSIYPVPVFSTWLSLRWVQFFTGAPTELVAPLIESLRHDMLAQDNTLQQRFDIPGVAFEEAVEHALVGEKRNTLPPAPLVIRRRATPTQKHVVSSVQRLPLPPGKDAFWVAAEYAKWLPRFFAPFIRVHTLPDNSMHFFAAGLRKPLLELTYSEDRSVSDRPLFYITGGMLADMNRMGTSKHRGRLEFRASSDRRFVIAAIYDFCPSLPWTIYRCSQAPVHLFVMQSFGRYLQRQSGRQDPYALPERNLASSA